MSERVRICDIAEELGLSTATVSNVIHGKTGKVSAETAERVTALLEEREYILSMAGKSGGDVYLSFLRGGKLHIAVQTGKDFFELGKSAAKVDELRQKFLRELRWFTDIIDELRVEETLYKKENDA